MSRIRGRGTKLELKGWNMLKEAGINFRKHPKGIFGNPDAANKSKKIAFFFDSAFWHGHDWENRKRDFKSKKKFWIKKIERNIERDKEVTRKLRRKGWRVVRIWEKEMMRKEIKKTMSQLAKINGAAAK